MKTLIALLMLFTLTVNAQSYECKDDVNSKFNIVITDDAYNLVIDSFVFVTKLDTIIVDSICTKYVPLNHFKDTLIVYKDNYLSLNGNGVKTTFTIIRELETWEEQVLFNKPVILINIE